MKEGKVYLVGAGPGDPELLTRKAWRILQSAEVVLHDDLVPQEILVLLPAAARVVNVGKRCGAKNVSQDELNERMISLARAGHLVARLKNGDPMLFGRGSEEIAALRQAGVEFEVIPGVTAALGAAASTKMPLTDRRHTSRVVFVTIHRASNTIAGNAIAGNAVTGNTAAGNAGVANGDAHNAAAIHNAPEPSQQREANPAKPSAADTGTTHVVYMPGSRYADLAAELVAMGIALETPCLLVSHATLPDETVYRTTLEHLAGSPIAAAPSLLIVGEVAAAYGCDVRETAKAGAERPNGWSAEILNFVMQHPFQES